MSGIPNDILDQNLAEMRKVREELEKRKLIEKEHPDLVQKRVMRALRGIENSELTYDEKMKLKDKLHEDPSTLGKLLTGGVALVAAPALLNLVSSNTASLPTHLVAAPLAALGAMGLYDAVASGTQSRTGHFYPAIPINHQYPLSDYNR